MSRDQRAKNASLLTISDDEVVRHGALAYNDGYADAREHGQTGLFLAVHYSAHDRESYLQGFKKGLRVHNVAARLNTRT